jgi:ubiquinone/menaquinone biosynthesis C-methylase UbiE
VKTLILCPICGSNGPCVYKPIKSKIQLQVHVCENCDFIFTSRGQSNLEISKSFDHLSCDADYSDIRIGKKQMNQVDLELLSHRREFIGSQIICDVAAGRGFFAEEVLCRFGKKVYCIEPDEYMMRNLSTKEKFDIRFGDIHQLHFSAEFDFLYSCHSLEHYSNPIRYLNKASTMLKKNGFLWINVPNLSSVTEFPNIDEYFYDKHRVYFDTYHLRLCLSLTGFEIIEDFSDISNLRVLTRKSASKSSVEDINFQPPYSSTRIVEKYSYELVSLRSVLPSLVKTLQDSFSINNVAIVGGGRMLDAFVKYGGLAVADYRYIADNYLSQATESLYGRRLSNLEEVLCDPEVKTILLLAKSSSARLIEQITSSRPDIEIHSFFNLINNVGPSRHSDFNK